MRYCLMVLSLGQMGNYGQGISLVRTGQLPCIVGKRDIHRPSSNAMMNGLKLRKDKRAHETSTTASPVHGPLCEGDASQAGQGETREQAASIQRRAKGKVRMHETFRRRVHIKGGPDLPIGWKVTIEDAEPIEKHTRINFPEIDLDAYEIETKESLEELKARIIALGQSQPNEY